MESRLGSSSYMASSVVCVQPCAPVFFCCRTVTPESLSAGEYRSGANLPSAFGNSWRRKLFSRQLRGQLNCLTGLELSSVHLSSRGLGNSSLTISCRRHGATCCLVKGTNYKFLSGNASQRGIRLSSVGAGAVDIGSTSPATEDQAQLPENVSGCGHVVKFLQKIATLRVLPALVFGLGVAVSLGPGHALAVASQKMSPEGKGLLASAWAGLVAGCLHTLTGPDHLAALAPLCIGRSRLQSAAVGALWGCGHDAGQIIFGLMFLLLKDKLHIELIRTWASRVVGLTLVTIGAVGIYESQEPIAVLAEDAGLQDVDGGKQDIRIKNDSKNATTFATGVVYGLQPDALLMILPALALPSRITGAAFLGMFLLGTILAMGSYTLFLSSCSNALQKRIPGITKNLTVGSSLIAIALGLGLVLSEFFGLSLF